MVVKEVVDESYITVTANTTGSGELGLTNDLIAPHTKSQVNPLHSSTAEPAKKKLGYVSMLPEPHGTDLLFRKKSARVQGEYNGEARAQQLFQLMQEKLDAAVLLEVSVHGRARSSRWVGVCVCVRAGKVHFSMSPTHRRTSSHPGPLH
jgi:hypothetical protein